MSQPAPESSAEGSTRRSAGQVVQERAMTQVSKTVAKDGGDTNVELALADAIKDLGRSAKRLTQDTCYAVDDRLI
jgi:hypothetical protein